MVGIVVRVDLQGKAHLEIDGKKIEDAAAVTYIHVPFDPGRSAAHVTFRNVEVIDEREEG